MSYVDLFAGPGTNRLRDTKEPFDGSPLIAMKLAPGFSRFLFVESDPQNVGSLQTWISQLGLVRQAEVVYGDCNQMIEQVIRNIPRTGPSFVFLDPPSPSLQWATVARISSVRVGYRKLRPEQFILFPYNMGIVRMMPLGKDPVSIWGTVTEEQVSRVMPDPSKWRAVYEARQRGEFEAQEQRRRFLYLYWMGLNELGYKHVLNPRLLETPNGRPLYDMFFVSDSDPGQNIMHHVLSKPRTLFEQPRLIMEDPHDFQKGEKWYATLKMAGQ